MGYERWERFAEAVERARLSAINTMGETAGQGNFRGAAKVIPRTKADGTSTGSIEVKDYNLTRFAAYLVAMMS